MLAAYERKVPSLEMIEVALKALIDDHARPLGDRDAMRERLENKMSDIARKSSRLFGLVQDGHVDPAVARQRDYNNDRPHSKLGWLTPMDDAARWQQNIELEGRSSGAFNDDQIPIAPG